MTDPDLHLERRESTSPRRRPPLWLLAAGACALLLAGVVVAAVAVNDPGEPPEEGASRMNVEVSDPAPPAPVPKPVGELEVLPPDMAAAAQPAIAPPRPEPPPREPEPVIAPDDGRIQASFDCAFARPGAEQMVCSDPSLAAADREMARAYRRAIRSGAPEFEIRAEQRDWVALREEAARRSPHAVAAIYFQRIDDLNAAAEREWPPGGYR